MLQLKSSNTTTTTTTTITKIPYSFVGSV